MGRLRGIRVWDYKREKLGEQKYTRSLIMEESSKEGTDPPGAALPDMMIMNTPPLSVGEDSLPDSKLVPAGNGSGVGFELTAYGLEVQHGIHCATGAQRGFSFLYMEKQDDSKPWISLLFLVMMRNPRCQISSSYAQMDHRPPELFFMNRMKKWIERLNKCVAVSGDYIKK
ncbi:hypothetical protein TNCV_2448941 [Trichonephila clavipes]|uniref:Uncharacterized protein n=1 Tax=Trichonephila clavipes TaxID=2585209 RepID=A0A8X6SJQ9_TRICX|nr:hypothetical protein TNCV_2448941 [Trichonephila clavipes]